MAITSISSPNLEGSCSVSNLLSTLFRLLDNSEVRYCVLHGWEGLPEYLPSDLDLAVHPDDASKLPAIIRTLHEYGYAPVQLLHYAVTSYRYDFAWLSNSGLAYAGIDITYEYREGGLILMSATELLSDRQRRGYLWVANPKTELAYTLAKKACKGSVSLRQQDRLKWLVHEVGVAQAQSIVGQLFGMRYSRAVVQACQDGTLPEILPSLKRKLWRTVLWHDPSNRIRNILGNSWRLLRRWLHPTGLVVVILGPDGVGKSTVIRCLQTGVAPVFRGNQVFHWRPMVLFRRTSSAPVTNPHADPPRGYLGSMLACAALLLDYWLGYLLLVWPLVARTRMVVFDRYFDDVLTDPRRYRYGGPRWFAERAAAVVRPRNALYVVLDADEDVILARKREIPHTELSRQRDAYLKLAAMLHAKPVSTQQDIDHTVQAVSQQILKHLEQRFQQRYGGRLTVAAAAAGCEARSTRSV